MDPLPTSLTPWEAKPACEPEPSSQIKRKPKARKRGKIKTVRTSPRPPLVFPRFPELPAELRLAIWELALPTGPRLVLSRFLGIEMFQIFGNPLHLTHIGPPALFWACREANAVVLEGVAAGMLRGSWADLREDVLFIPFHGHLRAKYRRLAQRIAKRVLREGLPVPAWMSVYDAPQIAVEVPCDDKWRSRLVQFMTHCRKLIRLFLVVSCERPTQKALEVGWSVAERIHRHQAARPWFRHPPLEIVILLERRKYAFPPGTWSMDPKDFLSKFTAVAFKPDHKAKIGRHGVLQSILPI